MTNQKSKWQLFTGKKDGEGKIKELELNWETEDPSRYPLPDSPPWRPFNRSSEEQEITANRRKKRGETFQIRDDEINMVNAALYLRRPLLITGNPGTGKSSLAYAVARQLGLGEVLYWPITTRTTLKDGLYNYDAIGRLQEVKEAGTDDDNSDSSKVGTSNNNSDSSKAGALKNIGKYITLGPLGTALIPCDRPRVLLIDEIDKSDIDLPNDLLTVFEEGKFMIPELTRIKEEDPEIEVTTSYLDEKEAATKDDMTYTVEKGVVNCTSFPFIVLTSNGERDFPAPFLRRCLCLTMQDPDEKILEKIVEAHFGENIAEQQEVKELITDFAKAVKSEDKTLATDQLLNAIFMVIRGKGKMTNEDKAFLIKKLMADLGRVEDDRD